MISLSKEVRFFQCFISRGVNVLIGTVWICAGKPSDNDLILLKPLTAMGWFVFLSAVDAFCRAFLRGQWVCQRWQNGYSRVNCPWQNDWLALACWPKKNVIRFIGRFVTEIEGGNRPWWSLMVDWELERCSIWTSKRDWPQKLVFLVRKTS